MFCEYAIASTPIVQVPQLRQLRQTLVDDKQRGVIDQEHMYDFVKSLEIYNLFMCDEVAKRKASPPQAPAVFEFRSAARNFEERGLDTHLSRNFAGKNFTLDALLALTNTNQTRPLLWYYGVDCAPCPYIEGICASRTMIERKYDYAEATHR